MAETKHTPGPWTRGKKADLWIYGSDGRLVCKVCPERGFNSDLIAAAPELLELLEAFVASRGGSTEFARAYVKAEAALRKAKGESR